jgi:hypothetical protein
MVWHSGRPPVEVGERNALFIRNTRILIPRGFQSDSGFRTIRTAGFDIRPAGPLVTISSDRGKLPEVNRTAGFDIRPAGPLVTISSDRGKLPEVEPLEPLHLAWSIAGGCPPGTLGESDGSRSLLRLGYELL